MQPNDRMEIIRFAGADLGYGRTTALSAVDFTVREGDFFGIIGPNGSGKTTILRAALGLLPPRAGEVRRDKTRRCAYVMQRQALDSIYPFTVEEVVTMGRYGCMGLFARSRPADKTAIKEALEAAGVIKCARHCYRDLSAGQKQRVLIARALASEADVLLLDEPTNDLDVKGEEMIMRLIRHLHEELGKTVVVVSHHLHVILNYARHIIFINNGSIISHSVDAIVRGDILSETYGIKISVREITGKRVIIPG